MRSALRLALVGMVVFLRGLTVRWFGGGRGRHPPAFKILDFEYKYGRGHHHALNQILVQAVVARGYSAHVLASRHLDASLRTNITTLAFRSPVYWKVDNFESIQWKARQIRIKTGQDLVLQRLGFLRDPSACLLVHTATPWHIQSLLEVMSACRSICLANIFLMLPPDFDVTPELESVQAAAYLKAWRFARRRNVRVRFWTENRLLAERFRSIGLDDVNLLCLPMALPAPVLRSKPVRSGDARPKFLFIGEPRIDKGFSVVLEALELAAKNSLDLEFRLRLTHVDASQRAVLERSRGPQLDLVVQSFYSEEAYFEELANADAVLLPYDPIAYRVKNSNIVSEALACGTPVIVPNGENSLHEFARDCATPCYVVMPSYSAHGLLQAMRLCAEEVQSLKAAANAAAPKVRSLRAPKLFVDRILS